MSYSQLDDEARILDFFKGRNNGYFVDIGAGDGVSDSNTRKLWELGWSGTLVEADLGQFIKLCATYGSARNTCLIHAAISDKDGIATFYRNPKLWGWSSLSEAWVDLWRKDADPQPVLGVRIERLGLAPHPDFLSIDTEGMDAAIIESFPQTFRPKLILAEIDKFDARNRINRFLNSRGYVLAWENIANGAWKRQD